MRKLLRKLLTGPVSWLANKYATRPDKKRVFTALTELRSKIVAHPGAKGPVITFNSLADRFIIFSDQHKGAKNGSDDFARSEKNYTAALNFYNQQSFHYIALGDCEELWENNITEVKKYNLPSFDAERLFLQRNAFTKIFGNHDLYWDTDLFASIQLEEIYLKKIKVYEGAILKTVIDGLPLEIYLTHGHQGDAASDGNAFSKWFIAYVWAPLQSFLQLQPYTPAYDADLKTEHNRLMYEWSASQPNLLLITGHTHQPVFVSLTQLERLYKKMTQVTDEAEKKKLADEIKKRRRKGDTIPDFTAYQPSYFNSGCCCFADGDITGIEIADGMIRLVKWKNVQQSSTRIVLEEMALENCVMQTRQVLGVPQ